MPIPATPLIALEALSTTSLRATVTGVSGVVYQVYTRKLGTSTDTLQGTITSSGSLTVTGLATSAGYLVQAYGLDAGGDGVSLAAIDFVSLAQATTVAQAIQGLFSSSPTLTNALVGSLWTGEVPEETLLPYGWLETPYTGSTYTFETEFLPATATIHLLAIGAEAAENLATLFKSVFDDAALSFTDKEAIWCVPRSYRLVPEMIRSQTGTLLYRAVLTYDLFLERDR